MQNRKHQYIDRHTQRVCTEKLYGDPLVQALYSEALERPSRLCALASSKRLSSALAYLNYDNMLGARAAGTLRFVRDNGVDLTECVEPPDQLNTPRKVFERQIRYWDLRPMPDDLTAIVCPADSRVLVGSLSETSRLFLKGKFFDYEELISINRANWLREFDNSDFAIFRLTPEKYHYVHAPVSGRVLDIYEIPGCYHSCNPGAVVALITPHSLNKRVVTIIDTDVSGGTGAGVVAVIEVVALMIGQIVQCYSAARYEAPREIVPGMFLERGQPKSLFRPGSSTVVLLFQSARVRFAEDLVRNLNHQGAKSRFSSGFGKQLVETDVQVRSLLGFANER